MIRNGKEIDPKVWELFMKYVESNGLYALEQYKHEVVYGPEFDTWYAGFQASCKEYSDAHINYLTAITHKANERWWRDLTTGEPLKRNVGEMLMLVVSELSEALEGHRKSLPDDKLPHRPMFEVELADALVRLLDIAGGLGLDLGGAYKEKMEYNATRKDHTREGRLEEGGKKY